MKCCVYIIYTIVITDSTYIMKIMKVTIILYIIMHDDEYNGRAKCRHYKIKEIDGGFRRYG